MVVITETQDIFFGQILEGRGEASSEIKKIEIKCERPLNITMAALDTTQECDEFVPIVVSTSETNKYTVCTLSKKHGVLQQKLELQVNTGETINLYLNCKLGKVDLTGHFAMLDDMDPYGEGEDDEEDDQVLRRNTLYNSGMFGEDDDSEEEDDDEEDEDDDEDDDEEEDESEEEEEEEEEKPAKKQKVEAATNGVKKNQNDEKPPKLVPSTSEQTKTLQGGVIVKEVKEGTGPVAKKGKYVHVYYSGRLKSNNKQFDKCLSGKPFKFRLGSGEVIKGWDVGIENMKVGGKRTLTIPPQMAYGNKRMGNDIPANSTLVFDVELKAVS